MYSITNKYDRGPDMTDQDTKDEIRELVYQKGKFDLNRSVLEEIQNKKFDDKFIELARNFYKFNDKRAEIKLEINNALGSNIKEVKSYD